MYFWGLMDIGFIPAGSSQQIPPSAVSTRLLIAKCIHVVWCKPEQNSIHSLQCWGSDLHYLQILDLSATYFTTSLRHFMFSIKKMFLKFPLLLHTPSSQIQTLLSTFSIFSFVIIHWGKYCFYWKHNVFFIIQISITVISSFLSIILAVITGISFCVWPVGL